MLRKRYLRAIISGALLVCSSLNAETYRIDTQEAFETFKEFEFHPGDTILFRSGETFVGQFKPKGSGNSVYPIIVDRYGPDTAKPEIDGNGLSTEGVDIPGVFELSDVEYWEVNNISVTNGWPELTRSQGIRIANHRDTLLQHMYIRNCRVHHIVSGGDPSHEKPDKRLGGIAVSCNWDLDPVAPNRQARYRDVRIEYNELVYPGRAGIMIRGGNSPEGYFGTTEYLGENIVVRGNYVAYPAGDGICMVRVKNSLVEYNTCHDAGYPDYPNEAPTTLYSASIWGGWPQVNVVYQYNHVYNHHRDRGDATAFDIDHYSTDVVYQYNYSHDNHGGMMLLMQGHQRGRNVVRYNISLDQDAATNLNTGYKGEDDTPIMVYNNLYVRESKNMRVGGGYLYNNIFYAPEGEVDIVARYEHDHNCYYVQANAPEEPNGVYEDPLFAGSVPNQPPMHLDSLISFLLSENSPCIDKGYTIAEPGSRDYFGNPLHTNAPDIGVHEYFDDITETWALSQKGGTKRRPREAATILPQLRRTFATSSGVLYDLQGRRLPSLSDRGDNRNRGKWWFLDKIMASAVRIRDGRKTE